MATHILGRLAAVYLTESGSIKMRLPIKPSRFSYVAEHSKDSGHNIDWFNVKIITRDNITIKRLIKETLAISSLKPEMNAMQSSVQLNVFS